MRLSITILALLLAAPVAAQESGTVDKPVVVDLTITSFTVQRFQQDRYPDWRMVIVLRDNNGKEYLDEHFGTYHPETNPRGADKILKQLNTMNFSTTSMVKRLLEHCETEGVTPPITVVGKPEVPPADAPAPRQPTPGYTPPGSTFPLPQPTPKTVPPSTQPEKPRKLEPLVPPKKKGDL